MCSVALFLVAAGQFSAAFYSLGWGLWYGQSQSPNSTQTISFARPSWFLWRWAVFSPTVVLLCCAASLPSPPPFIPADFLLKWVVFSRRPADFSLNQILPIQHSSAGLFRCHSLRQGFSFPLCAHWRRSRLAHSISLPFIPVVLCFGGGLSFPSMLCLAVQLPCPFLSPSFLPFSPLPFGSGKQDFSLP